MRLSTALSLTALVCAAHGQTQIGSLPGGTGQHFGAALIAAGFQNADTYTDLLVGAPNSGAGEIHCVSGKWLATGQLPIVLWSVFAQVGTGAQFGSSIAAVGDLTGDGVNDFVVGAPMFRVNAASSTINGALFLVDGASHAIVATITGTANTMLGRQVVSVGDQDGDGKAEVGANAPSTNTTDASWVHVISGSAFVGTVALAATSHASLNTNGSNAFGATIASGFDLDGNGKRDLAIGSPLMFSEAGLMEVVSADFQWTNIGGYIGLTGERMASAISASHDYDGDGVVDFVVGAPYWSLINNSQDGRAVVLSGARLRSLTLPFELASFKNPTGITPAPLHFGAQVCASPDLNRDGIGDFMIGSPDWGTTFPFAPERGMVVIYSGATLTKIASVTGANHEHLGDEILGAYQDVDGDFFPEFAVAGSLSDNPLADCGVLKVFRLFPAPPSIYCTAKTNSLGCAPAISWSGVASASAATSFSVTCASLINQTSGLIFYSHAPNSAAFQGGLLCGATPLERSPVQTSGGSSSGADCTGTFNWDFGARIASGVDPTLVAGAQIFAQCWSRDTGSASTTSLSDALRLLINP
jgi:hypothetical protein